MTIPTLTLFNNKGGVGKTSLLYHLAWMWSQTGYCVLACDLDPQANLSAAFLPEDTLALLWNAERSTEACTIFDSVRGLQEVGDIEDPALQSITPTLHLLPGDLALSSFEEELAAAWPRAMDTRGLHRPFRILTAFATVMQRSAARVHADLILIDAGPNLGAINRSVMLATDHVIVPLGADLFSLQGMRNLGTTLTHWREDWARRRTNWTEPAFPLPHGGMQPEGYVMQQHSVRLDRPTRAYERWVQRIPEVYARSLLQQTDGPYPNSPSDDCHCLATLKHYRSLIPLAQEARKPVFELGPADGALGSHAAAAKDARQHFRTVAQSIEARIHLKPPDTSLLS
ncbi:MAG: ParA family protein [Polyangiales bacterium]